MDDDRLPGETEAERLDRNLNQLLQELRVAQTGVQILFAFLLTLPFTQRFDSTTSFERYVYYGTLLASATATALIIAPVAFHRIVFRQHEKRRLVFIANRLAIAGLAFLSLAMIGVVLLITDVLFSTAAVVVATSLAVLLFGALWFLLPLRLRRQGQHLDD
jgi:hypothetical protein